MCLGVLKCVRLKVLIVLTTTHVGNKNYVVLPMISESLKFYLDSNLYLSKLNRLHMHHTFIFFIEYVGSMNDNAPCKHLNSQTSDVDVSDR